MIRLQTKAQPKTHEYQIKYRLTGAAIIVGFAIIVISVLLKEPSIESNTRLTNTADSQQTFKLVIPLPDSGNQNSSPSADSTSGYDGNDAKPALLEPKIDIPITSTTEGTNGNIVLTKDKKPASGTNSASSQTKPDELSTDISKNGRGWTVRVGTYSKTENVDKVSALLNRHGFDAQHVKVQTALGAATRIWLGPYTNKKTAEKVSLRLKEITGEKGYVTETSS